MNITVFTPTYNRAYIIEKLYRSLQRQTYTNFEWLVVDDGSTDNTEEIFNGWKNEKNNFLIRYYKQENGGKHRAINTALDLAKGRLFFVVDSDDYLTDDALEKIAMWEQQLPDGKYCGVAGNLGTSIDETPNCIFEKGYHEGTLLDRYNVVNGERAMAFYTDIHRKYPYPEFEGEKFITEAVAYNRMARDGYKIRFYNDIIWIYEYRDDGLTKSGIRLFLDNPRGYGLWRLELVTFMHYSQKQVWKMQYSFMCDMIERYDTKMIAECIGASRLTIVLMKFVYMIKHSRRNKNECVSENKE